MKKFKSQSIIEIGCLLLLFWELCCFINELRVCDNITNVIILGALLLLMAYGTISVFYVNITIDNHSLYHKRLFKKTKIMFNDIKSIKQHEDPIATNIIFKAIVYSDNEEIEISPLYGNYKELLQLVVDKCDESVFIESNIYEHLATKRKES